MDAIDAAAGYSALVAQQTNVDVSMAVLAKSLKVAQDNSAALLQAMPLLPPTGSLGRNLDVRA